MGLEINPAKCCLIAKNLDLEEIKQYSRTFFWYEREDGTEDTRIWGPNVHRANKESVRKGTRIARTQGWEVLEFGGDIRTKRVGNIFDENDNLRVTQDIRIG